MLRAIIFSFVLLLALMPVGMIEKTGASQSDQSESEGFLQAGSFVPPVHGPIRYSNVPVDGGSAFNADNPQTWYTMVWAGRYSGSAAQRGEGSGGHAGVDIRDAYGEQTGDLGVYAIADGVVTRRRDAGSGWGNFIAIRHDNVVGLGTIYSVYAHLDAFEPSIANGQEGQIQVTRGQRIATIGSTGLSSPAARHLHFQIDKSWPESKNEPYWPGTYPASEADASLTQEQRQQAAANVMANTINPMMLVETGSIGGQTRGQASVSPDCGTPGTLFSVQWIGFTPNSTLTSHLRKPDGTEFPILQFNTNSEGRSSFVIDSTSFPVGTYQHWAVDDATSARSNIETITVRQRTFESAEPISFGENLGFTFTSGRGTSLEFCANTLDVVSIQLNGACAEVRLFDPSLRQIAQSNVAGFASNRLARIYAQLTRSGGYVISIANTNCSGGQNLGLNVQRVNKPAFGRTIRCGQSLLSVLQARQRQTFTFDGSPNSRVAMTVRRTDGGNMVPFVEMYDPSGMPIVIQEATGSSLTISDIRLSEQGTYTILVSDTSSERFGDFTISLQCQ